MKSGRCDREPQPLTKDKCDSSSLPGTESHERIVNTHTERLPPLVNLVDTDMLMREHLCARHKVIVVLSRLHIHGWRAHERHDVDHSTMDMLTCLGLSGFNRGQTKGSSEGVGHSNELFLDMLATGTASNRFNVALSGQGQLGYGAVCDGVAKAQVRCGGCIVGASNDNHAQRTGGNLAYRNTQNMSDKG